VPAGELTIGGEEQRVVLRACAGLDVDDAIGAADHGVEDLADGASDQEIDTLVVETIDAHVRAAHARLEAQMELVHGRVLQMRVDDVDA
jgi:hypothetical protein